MYSLCLIRIRQNMLECKRMGRREEREEKRKRGRKESIRCNRTGINEDSKNGMGVPPRFTSCGT